MSTRSALPAGLLILSLAAAACGGGTPGSSPASSPGTSASPAGSSSTEAIAHPTGATDIVLRYDESGGFVPVEFLAAHVPYFTLYGDGTVVFVSSAAASQLADGGPAVNPPLRTAKLSEEQIQSLLQFALVDGGLAAAKTDYPNPLIADAPSTVFEVNAANDSKTVSIMALALDEPAGADAAIKAAFVKLAERLRDFDEGGTLASAPYEPVAYRGVLLEATGVAGVQVRDWPWESLTPADFPLPGDPNGIQQRKRVLTPEEAAQIGIEGFEGGIGTGLYLGGPDGTLYSFVLRPLLPDETE